MYEGYRLRTRRERVRRRKVIWFLQDSFSIAVGIFMSYLLFLGLISFFS